MEMVMVLSILQLLLKLCSIGFVFTVQGSTGYNISPAPAIFSDIPPIEGTPVPQPQPFRSSAPSSESQPNGSKLHPPLSALPPLTSAPVPQTITGLVPSYSPSPPIVTTPQNRAPPPLIFQGHVPSLSPSISVISPMYNTAPPPTLNQGHEPPKPPNAHQRQAPVRQTPVSVSSAPAAAPSGQSPENSTVSQSSAPDASSPSSPKKDISFSRAPIPKSIAPAVSPSRKSKENQPAVPPIAPAAMPSAVPVVPPIGAMPQNSSATHPVMPGESPSTLSGPNVSHSSAPTPSIDYKKEGIPVSAPPNETSKPLPPLSHSPAKAPSNKATRHSNESPVSPSSSPKHPLDKQYHSSVPSPSIPFHKKSHERSKISDSAPASPYPTLPPSSIQQGPNVSHSSAPTPSIDYKKEGIPVSAPPNETPKPLPPLSHSPAKAPSNKATRHSNESPVSPSSSPKPPLDKQYHSSVPSPSIPFHKKNHERSKISDSAPASPYPTLPPSSIQQGPVIPPSFLPTRRHKQYAPPPLSTPVTNFSPPPSPSPSAVSGWTKMPVLSPKATPGFSSRTPKMPPLPPLRALPPPPPNEGRQICASLTSKFVSVVPIMFFIFLNVMHRLIESADCSATVCTEPLANTPPGSPCGCVLPMQVGLSVSVALYTFFPLVSELAQEIAAGIFMKQSQVRIIAANAASQQPEKTIVLVDLVPLGERFDNTTAFLTYQRFWHKQVVINPSYFGDCEVLYVRYLGLPPSPPLAPSGIAIIDDGPYSGNNNNTRTIKPLGVDVHRKHKAGLAGGMIAIIVLSGFVALVLFSSVAWALLFRHRGCASQPEPVLQPLPPSVAKPSGIAGSLVGSGLSSASLSFGSSIPAYTGSAKTFSTSDLERATNSFNASRILGEGGFGRVYSGVLEDGTKVAVKVLKRDDQQGGREFLAEVEMLSRLHHRNLVKLIGICTEERSRSLVYELIPNGSVESHLHGVDKESAPLDWDARIKIALGAARGRRPVDMSQPPGQENLVAWARPLLTSKEGLEIIIDPSLGPDAPFDSVAKVAAIASMCVQPEVSHRPFMGEVVQALKLVSNECDEAKELDSRSSSEGLSIDMDAEVSAIPGQLWDSFQHHALVPHYDSEPDIERGHSVSDFLSTSVGNGRQASGSLRRCSSGPLQTGRGRELLRRMRLIGESVSERGIIFKMWPAITRWSELWDIYEFNGASAYFMLFKSARHQQQEISCFRVWFHPYRFPQLNESCPLPSPDLNLTLDRIVLDLGQPLGVSNSKFLGPDLD
ncbi:unnamed protein product [Dovyalis caffra]|uniref:Protein kinase domain-containing protein n=1 Tax=Dovyalis caffra TaxID=77055 RepID=A0AAV1SMZ5_9ROSI|nr:unnamed protein product [Dovyalis caffra]